MVCAELQNRRQDGQHHKRLRTGIHARRRRTPYLLVQHRHNLEQGTEVGTNLIDGRSSENSRLVTVSAGVIPYHTL